MRTIRLGLSIVLVAGIAMPGPAPADGGRIWLASRSAERGNNQHSAFPDGTAYTLNDDGAARSTDFGATWLPLNSPPGDQDGVALGLRFTSARTGFWHDNTNAVTSLGCPGSSPLFRTIDAGATWRPVCYPDPPAGYDSTPAAEPLAAGRDGRTIVVLTTEHRLGDCDTIRTGVIHVSSDRGEHWTTGRLPDNVIPQLTQDVLDGQTVLVLGYEVRDMSADCTAVTRVPVLYVTTDGGTTWQRRYEQCAVPPRCVGAALVTPHRILLGLTGGTVLVSDDGGVTFRVASRLFDNSWRPFIEQGIVTEPSFWAQDFGFADRRHGYASTRGSGTWRTSDGGQTWVQERSHECGYYEFGQGEVVAPTRDRAIAGGPGVVGTRTTLTADGGGCVPTLPNGPSPATDQVVRVVRGGLESVLDENGVHTLRRLPA